MTELTQGLFTVEEMAEAILSPRHLALRDNAARFAAGSADSMPFGNVRALFHKAYQANLVGLQIPGEFGGAAGDLLDLAVVAEAVARSPARQDLYRLLSSECLSSLLVTFGSVSQKNDYLPQVATGNWIQSVVDGAGPDSGLTIRRAGEGYILDGVVRAVRGGLHADLLYVLGRCEQDDICLLIEAAEPGLDLAEPSLPGGHSLDFADISFRNMRLASGAMLGGSAASQSAIQGHASRTWGAIEALTALAEAQQIFAITLEAARALQANGSCLFNSQDVQFQLADMKAALLIAEGFRVSFLRKLADDTLDAGTAKNAHYWMLQTASKVSAASLQVCGDGVLRDNPEMAFLMLMADTRLNGGRRAMRLRDALAQEL